MTVLFWILGLLVVGLLGYVGALAWGWTHVPEGGKSLSQYYQGLSTLHSEPEVTQAIVRALETLPTAFNTPPDVDDYDETFLRHIDESHGLIRIRTQEMCEGDLTPQFIIETPTAAWASFAADPFDFEGAPFDSVESELEYYLKGAKRIAEALVDEGLERMSAVNINGDDYSI